MQTQNKHNKAKTMQGDVINWIHIPRYWPFVGWIHRSPVNSPHNGQWRGPDGDAEYTHPLNDCFLYSFAVGGGNK